MNNVVPGYIMRDPEKLAAFLKDMGYPATEQDPVLPGTEDWVPEDETQDAQYMDDLGKGNLTSTIFRVVDEDGKERRSNHSTALNKPYYSTLRGARSAATYMRNRLGVSAKVQKGEVTWQDSDGTTP